jgi:poly(A) polymerase
VLARTIALERFAAGDGSQASSSGAPGQASPTGAADGEDGEDGDDELTVALGSRRADVAALLAEPLADDMTRGEALRWGALMHDAAKPLTRGVRADGRVTFLGHDERGASLAREVLGRLRTSERLRAHVAALARHHLRAGFLVHEPQPLARRTVFAYLRATEPVEVDVTLLSVADRLATRGDRAHEAIAAHLAVTRSLLDDALDWRAAGPAQPLLRGDELGSRLGIAPGPLIGTLLGELAAAQYAGEVATREQALAHVDARVAAIAAIAASDASDTHGRSE